MLGIAINRPRSDVKYDHSGKDVDIAVTSGAFGVCEPKSGVVGAAGGESTEKCSKAFRRASSDS